MIRLGLRLTLNGGKEAALRLVVTALAVALGVGLLLIALAGRTALTTQNDRTAWLNTGVDIGPVGPGGPAGNASPVTAAATADPLWWSFDTDHFGTRTIDRVDVAATGPHSPVPPGIPRLPGPGQFYASPALTRLLHTTPAGELGNRFPGVEVGTIGPAALGSPNSLVIVVGHTADELESLGASEVTSVNRDPRVDGIAGLDANKLQTVLAVGALALLFPILIFIATATRLAAARREQRFAAMRLVGATPRQVSVIAAVEASVAACAGVVLGFAVFFALRPALTNVPFTGEPFAPGDLSLGLGATLLVALGVPLAAAAAARVALRRVQISPLGVSRRVTPAPPRAYRVVPLIAGLAELGYFVEVGRPKSTGGQIDAYVGGCFLIMVGLVMAGPWLTMVGSRLIARRTSRLSVLLAGRRLADNPRAAFRAISGLILAVFATSVSVGILTTILDHHSTSGGSAAADATLVERLQSGPDAFGQPVTAIAALPPGLVTTLGEIRGVQGVMIAHVTPTTDQAVAGERGDDSTPVLASCAQLAHTPAIGRCPPGAGVVSIPGNLGDSAVTSNASAAASVWPAAPLYPDAVQQLPVRAIVVATDGKGASLDRVRTALQVALPAQVPPTTLGQLTDHNARMIAELRQVTDVVLVVSVVIAGCSLAVSVTAGVNDRKRPFSLLRLTGVPVGVLRRVVALEAAVPLVITAVVSAAMGFVAADLFLRSQLNESLSAPGVGYYVVVAAGLAASLAIIASTLPLIERITGPEIARNE